MAALKEQIAEKIRNFPSLYDKGNRATKGKPEKNAWLGVENACGYDENIKAI